MGLGAPEPLLTPPPVGPVDPLQTLYVTISVIIATLTTAFFGVPFYLARERLRRDHQGDMTLAESHIEDTRIVPALVALYEHVRRQMEEYPQGPPQAAWLDLHARELIGDLIEHVASFEELSAWYDRAVLYGDLVWKFAGAVVVVAILFPVLRFVWAVRPDLWWMTAYWSVGTVGATGLIVSFVLYTRARNRLMGLLEEYARR